MGKEVLYEIWIRHGNDAGIFNVGDEEKVKSYGEMLAIAKALVGDGRADEAVVLEKRIMKRFKKYVGEG